MAEAAGGGEGRRPSLLLVAFVLAGLGLGGWAVASYVPCMPCPACHGTGQTNGIKLLTGPEPVSVSPPWGHSCHACDGRGRLSLLDRFARTR